MAASAGLCVAMRGFEGLARLFRRLRQAAAIELAVGGQRQFAERHDPARHHRLRQHAPQPLAQLLRVGQRRPRHIGHQPPVLALALDDHRRVADAGLAAKLRLDLAGLDAEAAHLDLLVETAEELELAVRRRQRTRSPVR